MRSRMSIANEDQRERLISPRLISLISTGLRRHLRAQKQVMEKARGHPLLFDDALGVSSLKRISLGQGEYGETWLQALIHERPETIPITQIEPGFGAIIPFGYTVRTTAIRSMSITCAAAAIACCMSGSTSRNHGWRWLSSTGRAARRGSSGSRWNRIVECARSPRPIPMVCRWDKVQRWSRRLTAATVRRNAKPFLTMDACACVASDHAVPFRPARLSEASCG